MAKLKLLNTIFSKLGSLSKNDGQIVVTRDSKSLYIDLEGERIEVTDWIDIDNEESLLAILTPLINKYYYTKDTNKIWRYIGGEWKCLNDSADDLAPTYTESSTLLKLSSGEKLSVAFGKISKAITDLISHIGDSVKHITSTERTNWNAAKTHADSTHAPTNAQANVIETVKVNGTALTPSSKAVNITVPTNNNQLTNGAGYITSSGTAKTISDTLPISKGGTGKTTSIDAANALIGSLAAGDTAPTDDTNIIVQGVGGNYSDKFYRKPVSLLWNYIKSKLSTVATSGSYNDLSNKPTIPTVGNGTITIKQAGTSKGTFTMNQSGNTTIELTDTDTNTWRGIQNNLTSDSTTDSLSAAQGKVLKGLVDGKAASSHTHNYLPLSGGTITGSIITPKDDSMGIIPNTNNYGQIGSSDKKFYRMYATTFYGSLSGNADSATRLNTSAGSATQPVYFSVGKPVACTYTLGKSVPSNAVFTDTNTWRPVQNNLVSTSTSDCLSAFQGKVLNDKINNLSGSTTTPVTYVWGGSKACIYTDNEGGNLHVESPNGAATSEIDINNNDAVRLYFVSGSYYNAISMNGTTANTAGTFGASSFYQTSSRRIKRNIEDLSLDKAKKILDLNPVEFDYIESINQGKHGIGLIAEDTLKVIPEVVVIPDNYDETKEIDESDGMPMASKVPSINYTGLIPYMLKIIQEQQKEIDDIKAKLDDKSDDN